MKTVGTLPGIPHALGSILLRVRLFVSEAFRNVPQEYRASEPQNLPRKEYPRKVTSYFIVHVFVVRYDYTYICDLWLEMSKD